MVDDNFLSLIIVFILILCLQLFVVRKVINNLLDPYLYLVVVTSFALALGFIAIDSSSLFFKMILYVLILDFSYAISLGKRDYLFETKRLAVDQKFIVFNAILFIVFVAINLFVWSHKGVILLSENPSLVKSDYYNDGYGLIRRYNWSIGAYLMISYLIWAIICKKSYLWILLFIVIFVNLMGGSKGAFLPFILSFGLIIANPFQINSFKGVSFQKLKKWIPFLLFASTLPFVFIAIIESTPEKSALDYIMTRLFYYGDIFFYWGDASVRSSFNELGIIEAISDTFQSILGFFRISDYSIPYGNLLVKSSLPIGLEISDFIGPNFMLVVKADMMYGWFAPIYMMMIGCILSAFRKRFMNVRASAFEYSIYAYLVIVSITLPIDEGLAVGQIFDFFIYFMPAYLIAKLSVSFVKNMPKSGVVS